MRQPRFSANLGFLFTDRPLPEAIAAAAASGFDAVELHWPYATDPAEVRDALAATGLPLLGINTLRGDVDAGDFGLSALSGREAEARDAIDQAFAYAAATGARAVHVMAGKATGPAARRAYLAALAHAADRAAASGVGVLIEPLNPRDAPGYFLADLDLACDVLDELARPEARIMFDCYHMALTGRDLLPSLAACLPRVGHVQFAGVPDRAEPDAGEVDYARILPGIAAAGYEGFLGAEYRPRASTEAGLAWLPAFRAAFAAA